MDKDPHYTVWIVVTAFIAAASGAFLGVTLAPEGVVVSPEVPRGPSADTRELITAIQSLRDELQGISEDSMASPIPVPTERRPMEAGLSTEVEKLRALVAELRGTVESVSEPPPVAVIRAAREKDQEAVDLALRSFSETHQELLYEPYQDVMARLGRPDGIDEKGRLLWWATRGLYNSGMAVTVREGVVVNMELLRNE